MCTAAIVIQNGLFHFLLLVIHLFALSVVGNEILPVGSGNPSLWTILRSREGCFNWQPVIVTKLLHHPSLLPFAEADCDERAGRALHHHDNDARQRWLRECVFFTRDSQSIRMPRHLCSWAYLVISMHKEHVQFPLGLFLAGPYSGYRVRLRDWPVARE
jgi:hypothetical protein